MLHTVKNWDFSTRAIKVLFRSVHLVIYFQQKIGIKPHIRPLDLQGELISNDFNLMGC